MTPRPEAFLSPRLGAILTVAVLVATPVLAPAAGESPGLAAQELEWLDLDVGLIGQWRDLAVGATVKLDWESGRTYSESVPLRHGGNVQAELPFTLEADDNPESLTFGGSYGVLFVWQIEPPITRPMDPVRRVGVFELGLQAEAEALQRLENADLSLGGTFLYKPLDDEFWFLPAVETDLGYVGCVGCDLTADEDPGSWRVDATLAWSIPLGAVMPAFLDPLRLRPTGRVFKAWGVSPALAALRDEEGLWGQVELAYEVSGVWWLHELHVGWRAGDLPVRLTDEEAWSAGATVFF